MENDSKREKLDLKWKVIAFFIPYLMIDSSAEFYYKDTRIRQMRVLSGWGLTFYVFVIFLIVIRIGLV